MSQIWRPVDFNNLNDITMEDQESEEEDIVVISDEEGKDTSKLSLASGNKIYNNICHVNVTKQHNSANQHSLYIP